MVRIFKNFQLVSDNFTEIYKKMSFVVEKGLISWVGPQAKIPKTELLKKYEIIDLKNNLVFPSFIECHTHTVFAGSRAAEFELRNQGVSYLEIAKRGGGILSTMKATRRTSEDQLLQLSQKRVNDFLVQGVSTLEIKSGYALDLKNELKCLRVMKRLKGPRIIPTYLGAHAKPPEFSENRSYLEFILSQVLPLIKKKNLAQRVDIFTENNFFEKSESFDFLLRARQMGFDLTVHANQLSLSGGAEIAVELGALSADHLIHLKAQTIKKMARSKTVAVLLPTADLYMRCAYPPARKLIDAGVTVALATDYNPGSCPSQDLATVGLLARLEMKMSLPEVFSAYTVGAAAALGLQNEEGVLRPGYAANFICTEAALSDFFYSAGKMPEHQLFIRGKKISIPLLSG